jgi:hypothetical protein
MYYPKSQIKPNLYTSGEEFSLFTTKKEYIGYYYKTSQGKNYTGKNPQDGPNTLLIPYQELSDTPNSDITGENTIQLNNSIEDGLEKYTNMSFFEYPNLNSFTPRTLPQYNQTLPTQQEKELGIFSRYFCKKNNELIYLEIDQKTFTLLKRNDPKTAWDLYAPLIVLWQIKGDKEKTYLANKNNITLIESRQKWYGFSQYLKKDYTKYYVGV